MINFDYALLAARAYDASKENKKKGQVRSCIVRNQFILVENAQRKTPCF